MKNNFLTRPGGLMVSLLTLIPLTFTSAQTWTGVTNSGWGTGTNWTAAPAFNNTTDLLFDTSSVPNPLTTLTDNRIARSITFGADVDDSFLIGYRQFLTSGDNRTLTMQADSGNASITVQTGSTGAITMGANPNVALAGGALILGSNLDIDHNGSGLLLFNRVTTGNGNTITKSGTGTWQVNNNINNAGGTININGGTMIGNTFGAGDLNSSAALNLGGGTLEARSGGTTSGDNKNYSAVAVNVTSASSLVYNNIHSTTYTLSFSGTSSFNLGADLSVSNNSANTAAVNAINISRSMTGTGNLIFSTYNNISSNTDPYNLGRLSLSGDNSGWSGNLVISRGAVLFGGDQVNAAGTGNIIIGTTGDSFGAGLTFFVPAATPTTSTVTYNNDISVTSGGFRSIKGSNSDYNFLLTGNVNLEGTLNVDHTLSSVRDITLSGNISGAGGLDITRAAGFSETFVNLTGTNTYTGDTTVASEAALMINGSVTSDVFVNGGRFGGDGFVDGDLTMLVGSQFVFTPGETLDVSGSVSFDSSFSIASLSDLNGLAIDWSSVLNGTYDLIGTTMSDFSNIGNFGLANAEDIGGGRSAYFQNGSLQLVVVPEPSSAFLGTLAMLGFVGIHRRRYRC